MSARGIAADAKQKADVLLCEDLEKLNGWLVNCATAKKSSDVFAKSLNT
jgi:hypothetical protein